MKYDHIISCFSVLQAHSLLTALDGSPCVVSVCSVGVGEVFFSVMVPFDSHISCPILLCHDGRMASASDSQYQDHGFESPLSKLAH